VVSVLSFVYRLGIVHKLGIVYRLGTVLDPLSRRTLSVLVCYRLFAGLVLCQLLYLDTP
jgi:hypothetical protein